MRNQQIKHIKILILWGVLSVRFVYLRMMHEAYCELEAFVAWCSSLSSSYLSRRIWRKKIHNPCGVLEILYCDAANKSWPQLMNIILCCCLSVPSSNLRQQHSQKQIKYIYVWIITKCVEPEYLGEGVSETEHQNWQTTYLHSSHIVLSHCRTSCCMEYWPVVRISTRKTKMEL